MSEEPKATTVIPESGVQATAEQVAEEIPKNPRLMRAIVREVKTELRYSGPLPPPEMLVRYNDAFPGCAERIVAMAEKQSQHRQEMEKTDLHGAIRLRFRGQAIGAILAGIALLGGIGLLATGKSIEGYATLIGEVVVFGGAFVYDRIVSKEEEDEKPAPSESFMPAEAQSQSDQG